MIIQDTRTIAEKLKVLIDEQKNQSFIADYKDKATDSEALGIIISQYFGYEGLEIMRALSNALEDANFHSVNSKIIEMIDEMEGVK